MKYNVECQVLVILQIEANTKDEAENIAAEKIIEKCLYDADEIDWSISAYEEVKSNG